MRTIETTASVASDGTLTARVPPEVPPGEHVIVVVIAEEPVSEKERESLDLPLYDVGPWPEGLSLRREDMYGDFGR